MQNSLFWSPLVENVFFLLTISRFPDIPHALFVPLFSVLRSIFPFFPLSDIGRNLKNLNNIFSSNVGYRTVQVLWGCDTGTVLLLIKKSIHNNRNMMIITKIIWTWTGTIAKDIKIGHRRGTCSWAVWGTYFLTLLCVRVAPVSYARWTAGTTGVCGTCPGILTWTSSSLPVGTSPLGSGRQPAGSRYILTYPVSALQQSNTNIILSSILLSSEQQSVFLLDWNFILSLTII